MGDPGGFEDLIAGWIGMAAIWFAVASFGPPLMEFLEGAEKKYIDLEAEFKSCATLKKGRVGVDSYGGRRTTLKCLRLTREFLFKVVKDSSYPPIAVVEKARLFNYVEATCTNIVMSIDLIKKNSNLDRAVDTSLSCMVFKGMDWKLKNLGTEKD